MKKDKTIRIFICAIITLVFVTGIFAQTSKNEKGARQAVQSFFDAFNSHSFNDVARFTTEDWNHINPFGGRTNGREEVLKELKAVHSTFLKGVSRTIEDMSVRFVNREAAIVTVINKMGTYTTPDNIKHENERHITTFIVVKRNNKWFIIQDQTNIIGR
ncbi:MAG TPA: SgcJ/EcaC family oxidoreductase [Segetibacter sp.]|jgi:uncharacterized protein (TIGR02246 family)